MFLILTLEFLNETKKFSFKSYRNISSFIFIIFLACLREAAKKFFLEGGGSKGMFTKEKVFIYLFFKFLSVLLTTKPRRGGGE